MKTNIEELPKKLSKYEIGFYGLVVGFSNRDHGQMKFVSGKRDEVLDNRESFLNDLGIAGKGVLVRANQVHSNRTVIVGKQDLLSGANRFSREIEIKSTDGLLTEMSQVWLSITVADCVPILIWSEDLSIVGAVHAGWQGTLAKIASKAISKIRDHYSFDPGKLLVWIGPSIGPEDFEVKNDVLGPFKKKFKNSKYYRKESSANFIDLWQINRDQLISEGVKANNIVIQGESTYSNQNYFSYRRGDEGRMMGLIGIDNS